jgi:hypothetical protein
MITSDKVKAEVGQKLGSDKDWTLFPCTPLQAGMFGTTMGDPSAYVMQLYWIVEDGKLGRIVEGWRSTVKHHRLLSSRIVNTSGGLYQIVPDVENVQVETVSQRLKEFLIQDKERGFGEDSEIFSRLTVVQEANKTFVVLTMHHCVYDGWTLGFLLEDWREATEGRPIGQSGSFVDFVRLHHGSNNEISREYWVDHLKGVEASTTFSKAQDQGVEEGVSLHLEEIRFGVSLEEARRAASLYKTTVANLCRVAWALVLQVMTSKDDVVFGEVVSGRDVPINGIER